MTNNSPSTAPSEQDGLIEAIQKALTNNGEMLTLVDTYGHFKETNRLPSIGWMIPEARRMQESITSDIVDAILPHLESQYAERLAERDAEIHELKASRERLIRSIEFQQESHRQTLATYHRAVGMEEPKPDIAANLAHNRTIEALAVSVKPLMHRKEYASVRWIDDEGIHNIQPLDEWLRSKLRTIAEGGKDD